MNCCRSYEACFDQSTAADELKTYRRHGPTRQTRCLLDTLRQQGVDGLSLLDIGGGIGAIQHELLRAGASRATHVDASSAYLRASQAEAERQGHSDRTAYLHGDFVQLAAQVEPADIVTLDRVLCCYHNMPALVRASAACARRWYGLVFPRDTWWVKLGVPLLNFFLGLRREPFKVFVHPTAAVDALAREQGFVPVRHRRFWLWQVLIYQRQDTD